MKEENGLKVYRFYPCNWFSYINIDKKNFLLRLLFHFEDTFNYHHTKKVSKIIKKIDPDKIITHNLKGINLNTVRAIRKSGKKHIHVLHDVQLIKPSGLLSANERLNCLDKIYASITRRIFKSPEVVISPSQYLIDFYKNNKFFLKSKIEVIPNPIIIKSDDETVRKKDEKIRFLYLGLLEKQKGLLQLIEAFKKIDPDKAKLIVAGKGSLSEELRIKNKELKNVEFRGFIERKNVGNLIKSIDITVIPSLIIENSPTVIYESFYYQKGVIASRLGGIPEMVKNGENGFLFTPGSVQELAENMEKIVNDHELIDKFSNSLYNWRNMFSLDAHLSKLEKVLE